VSTVTAVTVVPAAQQGDQSGAGSGTKTNTANASLQTGGGNSLGVNVAMGALGLAAVVAL